MDQRKLKISSIEIMGILGFFIWMLTIFLRKYYPINSVLPVFRVTPNFGGAWLATAMLKQIFCPMYVEKKVSNIDFSKKTLFFICAAVILMALINEMLPIINTSSSFDLYDVLATVIAEILAFSLPVLLREKTLIEYRQ